MEKSDMSDLYRVTKEIRKSVIDLHCRSKTSHLGSSLSCVDIIATLYYKIMNVSPNKPRDDNRDRFILSKGHAAPALYVVLNQLGYFPKELLDRYGEEGTSLFEHPEILSLDGIEASTGSLGHGLPIGLGIALAGKLKNLNYRVFVLMSDGECQEGSVWEAVMMASALSLDNLICIVDYNNLQGYDVTEKIQSGEKVMERFKASGWDCKEVEGNDILQLYDALKNLPIQNGSPTMILAKTTKGKGVKDIEGKLEWHYKSPTLEQAILFKSELG